MDTDFMPMLQLIAVVILDLTTMTVLAARKALA